MVVNNLKQVVFCVLKYDEDAFVLKDDLNSVHNIRVCKLGAKSHLSYGGLRNSRILEFTFLVWLEPTNGERRGWNGAKTTSLLNSKFSNAAISTFGFVHTSIRAAADEAYNLVSLVDTLLVVVAGEHGLGRIGRICQQQIRYWLLQPKRKTQNTRE